MLDTQAICSFAACLTLLALVGMVRYLPYFNFKCGPVRFSVKNPPKPSKPKRKPRK